MLLGKDIGIDLGTTAITVSVRGKGVVLHEPAVVAMDKNTGKILDVGTAAQRMLGRTPGNMIAIMPLREGVISDCEMAEKMLSQLVRSVTSFSLLKPRILISIPSCVTEVEERAVIDAGIQAGARKVYLLETPIAAALGAGMDISNPEGHFIVDIGGGKADVAVLSLGGIVQSASIKAGGDAFNDAIVRFVRRKHGVLIGTGTAEELKKTIGCVFPRNDTTAVDVKGRCLMTGLPRVISISSDDILEAFKEVSERIIEVILNVLESTPPELVADISQNGIVLTGGGSLLWGFDKLIEAHTGIRTMIADDAEMCVAYGVNKYLDKIDSMNEGTLNLARRRQMRE